MKARKRVRTKGKIPLSRYFQELKPGDTVALVRDLIDKKGLFPSRFHGLTGTVEKKIGRAYMVKFLNGKVLKRVIVKPLHLKKLENGKTK
ncbi:MAG: 50S ribosomal protein L21e [archaeon]